MQKMVRKGSRMGCSFLACSIESRSRVIGVVLTNVEADLLYGRVGGWLSKQRRDPLRKIAEGFCRLHERRVRDRAVLIAQTVVLKEEIDEGMSGGKFINIRCRGRVERLGDFPTRSTSLDFRRACERW